MKNAIALIAVAGIAAAAAAQTATVTVSPSATSINTLGDEAARTVRVSVTVTGSAGLTSFDVVMDALQGNGLFTIANASLDNGLLFTAIPNVSEVTGEGPLGLRGYGAGALLSGTDVSGQQFSFDLIANAGAAGDVELTGITSGFSPIATMGLFASAYPEIIVNSGTVTLFVPAPASAALLGLGGLAATRRRR
ncbi:MAG: hypothetical protein CMJ31_10510 [Phycisphaerae bacterium]|nr:hypothetical protein [Phycisphaerae bacterium]